MNGSCEVHGLQTAPQHKIPEPLQGSKPDCTCLHKTPTFKVAFQLKIVSAGNEEKGQIVLHLIQKKIIPSRELW